MALSNWDLLTFDTDGNSSDGKLELPNKQKVEIYKNWLYVHNCKFGNQKRQQVISIQSGDVKLFNFNINAIRYEEQHAVFCFVEHCDYSKKNFNHSYFCGIGCSGFEDTLHWLKKNHYGVYRKIPKQFLDTNNYWQSSWTECGGGQPTKWGISFYPSGERRKRKRNLKLDLSKFKEPSLAKLWVGVKPKTLLAFSKWLKTVAPEEYFKKIDFSKAKRFNQGDAFFNKHIGTNVNGTSPGKSKTPIIASLI